MNGNLENISNIIGIIDKIISRNDFGGTLYIADGAN